MTELITGDSPVGFALIDTHDPSFVPDASRVKLSVKKRMWNYASAADGSGPIQPLQIHTVTTED